MNFAIKLLTLEFFPAGLAGWDRAAAEGEENICSGGMQTNSANILYFSLKVCLPGMGTV